MKVLMKEEIVITDEELMLEYINGNKKSFYILVNRWNKKIINYFYRNIGNLDTSEDLAQELFINIWKVKNYSPKFPFYKWIYKIANNKLIDFYRKNKILYLDIDENKDLIENFVDNKQPIDEQLIEKETENNIKKTLMSLKEEEKNILIMSKYQKLKYEEIGEILGIKSNNVKIKVFRAIKSFTDKFKELYGK